MTAYIGYNNLIEHADSAITVTSEATGYEKENAYDWLTSDWWKAAAAGTVYYTIDLGSAKAVDYFGLAAHNLPDNSGTIELEYSSTGAWAGEEVTAVSTITPSDNAPIFRVFTSATMRYWRFKIVATTNANLIGVLSLGVRLELPSEIPLNFTPPSLARDHSIANNVAEKGAFLGRTLERNGYELDLKQNFVTPSWIRTYWEPLADHVDTKPFFFSWDYENYPDEAVLAWADKMLPKPSYSHANFMKFQIKGRALHVI